MNRQEYQNSQTKAILQPLGIASGVCEWTSLWQGSFQIPAYLAGPCRGSAAPVQILGLAGDSSPSNFCYSYYHVNSYFDLTIVIAVEFAGNKTTQMSLIFFFKFLRKFRCLVRRGLGIGDWRYPQ